MRGKYIAAPASDTFNFSEFEKGKILESRSHMNEQRFRKRNQSVGR